jgi:hypothetical protein
MSIRADLIRYFETHPNEKLWAKDIAPELQLTEKQVKQEANNLIRGEKLPGLEVAVRANAWIFRQAPDEEGPSGSLTVVKELSDGSLVCEDSEAHLYRAYKLEIML